MTRASKLVAKLSEKEKIREYEFWVNKSDAKEAMQSMIRAGLAKGDISDSAGKISGMKVWTITSTDFQMQNMQHELAQKDINSWLKGDKK